MPLTGLSDVDLLDRVRAGCSDSFTELWTRHWQPVLTSARQYRDLADPEDLAQEAFARVHQSLRRGGGPFHSFRPYLYRTVHNIAVSAGRVARAEPVGSVTDLVNRSDFDDAMADPSGEIIDRSITVQAFSRLPSRWQEVLWYTVVEGLKPREVAELLGMTPNAVSALLIRAREGLRTEWLRAHTRSEAISPVCRKTVSQLPEYARGLLSRSRRAEIFEHLGRCVHCSLVSDELEDLAGRIRTILLPLILGPAAAELSLFGPVRPEPALPTAQLGVGAAQPGVGAVQPGPSGRATRRGRPSHPGPAALAKIAGIGSGLVIAGMGAWSALNLPSTAPVHSAGTAEPSSGAAATPARPDKPTFEVTDVPGSEAPDPPPARTWAGSAQPWPGSASRAPLFAATAQWPARPGDIGTPGDGPTADDPGWALSITGPAPGVFTATPEVTGRGRPGTRVSLLDPAGTHLGLSLVSSDGTWAITPSGLTVGTHRFIAVSDDSVTGVVGPYELVGTEDGDG
jgi:RNA polymerase sigma factor (sigma-70 family)